MTDKTLKTYSLIIAALVVLSAAGNMIYASKQVIPEPLFTAVNDELTYSEMLDEKLTISYITNNSDARRLESISFEGLESTQLVSQTSHFGGFFYASDANDNPYNDIIGRYYTFKRGYIDLYLTEEDIKRLEENGSLTFGTGTATMDDGTTMPVSLGRIKIYTNENWDKYGLRTGGRASDDHFTVDFETETQIIITSLDLSSFEPHQDDLDLVFTADSEYMYTYNDLKNRTEPIRVDRNFQVECTTKDPEVQGEWRFNMIAMDMDYEMAGQSYNTWIYYPFYYSTGMDESAVEAYVELWRSENE